MLDCLFKKVDPPIDYVGQELASKLLTMIFIIGYALAISIGYILDDLKYALFITIATTVIAFLFVVPAWPFYRRNPVKFVESKKKKD